MNLMKSDESASSIVNVGRHLRCHHIRLCPPSRRAAPLLEVNSEQKGQSSNGCAGPAVFAALKGHPVA